MPWKHLVLVVSVLGWIGCGGAADMSNPATATNSDHGHGHDHDHGDGHAHDGAEDEHEATPTTTIEPEPAAGNLETDLEPELAGGSPEDTPSPESSDGSSEMPAVSETRPTGLTAHHAASTLVGAGDPLPSLIAQDFEGNDVSVASLQEGARVLVLVIWDSEIDFSKLELEYLERQIVSSQADQGVRVVGINRGESAEVVQKVIEEHGVSFPMLLDPNRAVFEQLATKSVPRTYVVDSQGQVRNLWVGFTGNVTIEEIQKEINSVLAE